MLKCKFFCFRSTILILLSVPFAGKCDERTIYHIESGDKPARVILPKVYVKGSDALYSAELARDRDKPSVFYLKEVSFKGNEREIFKDISPPPLPASGAVVYGVSVTLDDIFPPVHYHDGFVAVLLDSGGGIYKITGLDKHGFYQMEAEPGDYRFCIDREWKPGKSITPEDSNCREITLEDQGRLRCDGMLIAGSSQSFPGIECKQEEN